MSEDIIFEKHLDYLKRHFMVLPYSYKNLETNRLALLFFVLSSLDVLDRIDVLNDDFKKRAIEWIYKLQLTPKTGCPVSASGFRGSLNTSAPDPNASSNGNWCEFDLGHISQTYVALCSLLILGDSLENVDKRSILKGAASCQVVDGSFCAQDGTEHDMRFVYCAAAICYILDDFSELNMDSMLNYIRLSISYDGGIGQGPSYESHGGSTYCAVATLAMTGHLWDDSVLSCKQIERLKKWAVHKQRLGFHGRTNKEDDCCYAFWLGATLKMLEADSLIDVESARKFLLSSQHQFYGGFSKCPELNPDPLHTYFGLAALSLFGEAQLVPIVPMLDITIKSYDRLKIFKRTVV